MASALRRVCRVRLQLRSAAAAVTAGIALSTASAWADVTFDGSLGRRGSLGGAAVLVPAERGQTRGGNLFHGFSRLDVARGQSVIFQGPASITNVIARVSGGAVSTIDGTLGSDIAGANLFLINPAGVVFGRNAALAVSGSFAVTTADTLKFADGGHFEAAPARTSVLSSSPPAAFGFLPGGGGAVLSRGARLAVPNGRVLSVVSDEIGVTPSGKGAAAMTRSRMSAEAGRINLVGVGDSGTIELDATSPTSKLKARGFASMGGILVTGNALLSTDGESGGMIALRGGRMNVEASRITASTYGTGDGTGIDIAMTEQFSLSVRGGVFSDTFGTGDAGKVTLVAPRIDISGARVGLDEFSGVGSASRGSPSRNRPAGRAGDVNVTADTLRITANGKIGSETSGRNGGGGNVNLTVGGLLEIDGSAGAFLTGISTRTQPTSDPAINPVRDANGDTLPLKQDNSGRGGDINILAGALRMSGGGRIDSQSGEIQRPRRGGSGDGGTIRVNADRVILSGFKPADPVVSTGIRSNSQQRTTGDAGDISVTAGDMLLTRGGAIEANTNGTGAAGLITIDAKSLTIREKARLKINDPTSTPAAPKPQIDFVTQPRISSAALGNAADAGRGRVIFIDAGRLVIDSGGTILAVSGPGTSGAAGRIQLNGDAIAVGGGGSILASTGKKSSGSGGDIRIGTRSRPVDRLIVRGGVISAATNGRGDGGEISGSVNTLEVTRRGQITADSIGGATGQSGRVLIDSNRAVTLQDGGAIRSSAQNADAGSIRVRGSSRALLRIDGGEIVTDAPALGRDGGDIALQIPRRIEIDGGRITTSSGGGGGNVFFAPRTAVLSGAVIAANATTDDGGNITIMTRNYFRDALTRITADSTLAEPGTIAVQSAQVDLSNVLTPLNGAPSDPARLLDERCKVLPGEQSSFTVQPRGGVGSRQQ
ncbi:MAG TPA: filamentous hemagglutinin N-terminal domain-containing protein [Tepidisphaeraceae bacterium]